MKKYIWLLFVLALVNACSSKSNSTLKGIVGTDDSVDAVSIPAYSVSVIQKMGQKSSYCNGVKLLDGRFLSALHCFKNSEPGTPIVTSGGLAVETSREAKADLLIGRMIGGVAPSDGTEVFDGSLPLAAELETHWFDPFSKKWKLSKGHGKRKSADDLVWEHDLDLNPGASGAGLFIVTADGHRKLAGIHLGYKKDETINIALVTMKDVTAGRLILPKYRPEICFDIGVPTGELDANGKPVYEWYIDPECQGEGNGDGPGNGDGEGNSPGSNNGPGGGTPGGDNGGGPQGPGGSGPNGPGGSGPNGPGGGSDGSDGGSDGDDGLSGSSGGGILIDPYGPGSGGNPAPGGGEPGGGGPNYGNLTRFADGERCHACVFYNSESDEKSLFKPECDVDSGFTGLFGQKTPTMNKLYLPGVKVTQTRLSEALKSLAEKLVAEKKWKTPDGLPSKTSLLSDETRNRLQNWLNQVMRTSDDYYALIISSLNSVSKPAEPTFDDTVEGIKSAQQYIDFLKKQIAANPDEFQGRRYSLLDASQQFLKFADIEIKNGNRENAQISLNLALASADATLSVAPAVGWGKDIYEAWTGYSLVSGKKLSRLEHSMAVGGAVSLGVAGLAGATVKTLATSAVVFTKVARAAKTAEEFAEIEKATENILEMAKNAEKAGVSAEIVAEGLRSTQKVLSEGKHVETVAHDGRSMYKLKDLNPGKPDFVSDGVNSTVKNLVKEKGYTNLDLIKDGYAPIGADGRQINLHHIFAYEPGPVIEMEAKAHTKEFKEFHKMIKESFRNNGSSADNFDDFREIWWLNRAKDFPE